jgi:hypothetical protein
MISAPELLHPLQRENVFEAHGECEECELQFAAAEKEMSAFVIAVKRLFGVAASAVAARCWVELAESIDLPSIQGRCDWRQITIKAASLVASMHPLDEQDKAATARAHRR